MTIYLRYNIIQKLIRNGGYPMKKNKSIIAVLSAATLLLSFVACSSPSGGGSGSGSGGNSQNANKEAVENGS